MSVSLPDPSEMDSLLLDDTGGNGGDSDEENGESMGRNEHETGDSGSGNGESAFDYDWCEAQTNMLMYLNLLQQQLITGWNQRVLG